ncbi:hypothetical protein J6590_039638, partial [Homalodisca vitripennis]
MLITRGCDPSSLGTASYCSYWRVNNCIQNHTMFGIGTILEVAITVVTSMLITRGFGPSSLGTASNWRASYWRANN